MQFIIVEKVIPDKLKNAVKQNKKAIGYFDSLRNKGKLLHLYHFAGQPGGVMVFDVESNDELGDLLANSPFFPYTTREIYPVMSEDAMLKAESGIK